MELWCLDKYSKAGAVQVQIPGALSSHKNKINRDKTSEIKDSMVPVLSMMMMTDTDLVCVNV